MNWLSRKLLQSVPQYQSLDAIQVLQERQRQGYRGEHGLPAYYIGHTLEYLKLRNLELRTDLIKSQGSPVLLSQCRIGLLELRFDPNKLLGEPIGIKVDDVLVVLRLNEEMKIKEDTYSDTYLEDYRKHVFSRTSVAESYKDGELGNLKLWLVDLANKKINLFITRVTIALECDRKVKPIHYLGLSIDEIIVKSRTVVAVNREDRIEEKEVELKGIGAFVGVSKLVNSVQKFGPNREVMRLDTEIKRLYFMRDLNVLLVLVVQEKKVDLQLGNLIMNFTPYVIKELNDLVNYMTPILKPSPKLRPGQGDRVADHPKARQGTRQWWRYIGNTLIKRIEQHRQYNIVSNPFFRRYVFCVIYSIVAEPTSEMNELMILFEKSKKQLDILHIHQYILERIARIQENRSVESVQERVFMTFIFKSVKNLKNKNIERLQYIDFASLKREIYTRNGRDYIHKVEMQSFSQFSIKISLKSAFVYLTEFGLVDQFQRLASQQLEFRKQYDNLHADKESFGEYVEKIYWNFVNRVLNDMSHEMDMTVAPTRWTSECFRKLPGCYAELQISNVKVQRITSQQLCVSIERMMLTDLSKICYNPCVLEVRDVKIKKVDVSKQNRTFVVQRSGMSVEVDYVCVNMLKPFIEKVLFIVGMTTFDMRTALEEVIETELTLGEVVHNKLFKSRYLKQAVRTQTYIRVHKLNLLLPMDYSVPNDILVTQILGAEVNMVSPDLTVLSESTKMLFVNSYRWVERDSVFKRVMQEKQNPGEQPIMQSVIINLGPMAVTQKEQLRQKNMQNEWYSMNVQREPNQKTSKQKTPNEFINKLIFSIPLVVVRISIKQLFQLNYLIGVWMQTGFTPQQFFKKRHISRYRPQHNFVSPRDQPLLKLMTEQTHIQINAIALSMATVKYKSAEEDTNQSEDLFEIFVNEISVRSKGYGISSELEILVGDVSIRNLSGHIPINRLVMLRFGEAMLRNSDFYRSKHKGEEESLEEMIGEGVSVIGGNRTPKVNLPSLDSRQFNLEEPNACEQLLRGIDFQETERSKLYSRLLLYNDSPSAKTPFMRLLKSTKYLAETRQVENTTKIQISILCFLMDPDFFKNCVLMYECAKDFRLRRQDYYLQFVRAKGYIASIERPIDVERKFVGFTSQEQSLMRQNNVIVDVAETNINSFSLVIEQINFMIYHKECVVYSILIKQFGLQMQEHFLLDDMKITARKVVLLDTHPNAGEWPEMLRVGLTQAEEERLGKNVVNSMPPSFELELLIYKNQILIRKNFCKTEMLIQMRNSTITYLNKKVMELVNCIMFIVGKLMAVKKKFRGVYEKATNKAERFLYSITIDKLKLILPQNSLAKEHLVGTIQKGWVGNSEHFLMQNANNKAQVNTDQKVHESRFDFEPCDREDSELLEFQSFLQPNEQFDPTLEDKVIVQVTNLVVMPKRMSLSGVYMLNIPICKVDIDLRLANKTLIDVSTDKPLSMSMNQLEFQLLMRTFTQNFIEKTLVFDDDQLKKEQRMNRQIDQEFRLQLQGTNILQEREAEPPSEQLRVTTEVYVTVFEAGINVYGTDYNLSLMTHSIVVIIKLFNDSSKDIDLAIETVQFYNNISNKMFINSYDDERDNAMGDLIYQPPANQVFQTSTKFTQEDKNKYVEKVSQRYRFRPRNKEDLDVHNQTATTKMEGWSQEDIVQSETKLGKMKKCLKRVFCGCCPKNEPDRLNQTEIAGLVVDALNEGESLLNAARDQQDIIINAHDYETQEQLNRSYITSEEEIIQRRFFGRQLQDRVRDKTTKSTFMTMMIHMCNTGQKNIQLFLNNLNMAMSDQKEIIYLANYMVKGFQAEKQGKIRKHLRYNNFPPFYLAMKMSNSKVIIGKSLDEDSKSYLQSIQDVVISQERIGDTTQGPGTSKMKVEVKVVLNYCRYYNRRLEAIQLSRPINIIITENSEVPLMVNTAVKHSGLKQVLIFGDASKKVQINLPLTYTNDIIRIVTQLTPAHKPPEGTVDVVFEKQQTPQHILGFLLKLITDNVKVMVPGVIIELMSGKRKSLLKLELEDVYMDIISVNNSTERYGKMRAFATLMAHYINMKSEVFEPALEPVSLCVKVKGTKLNGVVHEKIRIGSISGSTEFENSLNINLSLGLIRNLKEAWTRYNGNYQVESDSILDLSVINWGKQLTEQQEDQLLNQYRVKREFISTFFGKKFLKLKLLHEQHVAHQLYWNIKLQQYLVLHSFFDYDKGRKIIHIRTPYRFINHTGKELKIAFRKKRTQPYEWIEVLKPEMCYSIPKDIYTEDILMTPSFDRNVMTRHQGTSVLYLLSEYEERENFTSKRLGKALYYRAFRLSTDNPKRYVRKSDFVLECDNQTILGVCVKSCRLLRSKQKSRNDEKNDNHPQHRLITHDFEEEVHQTSILLLPPLVIRNELPMYMEMFVDERPYNLPASSEMYVTHLHKQFTHSTISFKKFTNSAMIPVFLQVEDEKIYKLNISQTDSIGMKVSRLSELCRQIVLYSTYIIRNQTYEDFSIEYEKRVYILERYFWLFITDSDIKNNKRKAEFSFYKNSQNSSMVNFQNDAQVIKLQRQNEESKEQQANKLFIDVPKRKRIRFTQEPVCDNVCCNGCRKCMKGCLQCMKSMLGCQNCSSRGCLKCFGKCGKKTGCERACQRCCGVEDCCNDSTRGCIGAHGCCSVVMRKCPNFCRCSECCEQQEIKMDTSTIIHEIVVKKHESTVNISQTIILFYRFEIVNQSSKELVLFHHNSELMRLEPKIRRQVHYYKSNSQWFRVARYIKEEGKLLYSDLFRINEPRQFIVRVPKELYNQKGCQYPYQANYLYTVRVSEAEDLLFIRITETDMNRFPIYFKNNTSYNVRVIEGDQDFGLPPGEKIPFFFTNLDFKKGNELLIEVEGVRKVVKMNEMSDMESFGLNQIRIGPKKLVRKSFKRGKLGIIFNEFHGDFNVVVAVLEQQLRIYDEAWRVQQRVNLKQASIIDSEGNKIYIYLPDNDQLLLTIKNPSQSASWKEVLADCLSSRSDKRIFMMVDSDRNSRIIKLQETGTEDMKSIRKLDIEVFLKNLSIAMISGSPAEVILLDLKNIRYDRTRDIKRSLSDNILSVTYDDVVIVGKAKISNQTEDTSNPVVAAQNRRGDFPCFELKASKRFTVEDGKKLPEDPSQIEVDDSLSTISHYTTLTFFLDEMEIIMDSQLVMIILDMKRDIERNLKVYDARRDEPIAVDILDINAVRYELIVNESSKEVYINYLNIEPIKITMSVSWSEDIESEVKGYGLGFLGRLPFGIESATIQLNSFTSYHVFEKRNVLLTRVLKYYLDGAIFQVLNNAGSYDLLAPLRIINGVGEGARNIFYEPIYTLYKKKEVKATASKFFEGCVIFLVFLLKFFFKLIDVLFRLFSFFTIDSAYTQRRNNFHKHTMKSPIDGFRKGGKFFLQMISQFFTGFIDRPKAMYERYGGGGIVLGILLAFLGIIKVLVGIYDFFWAVGSGFVNFAVYEPEAMDVRSRPIRIFKDGTIEFYNYSEALAHEVMHSHNIPRLRNEIILYAKKTPYGSRNRYYIISNYRFIYCTDTFHKEVVKFYCVSKLILEDQVLTIDLAVPERTSYFLFTLKKHHYKFKFITSRLAQDITERLDKAIRSNAPLSESSEPILGSLDMLPK